MMVDLRHIRLVLFFTRNVSLQTWARIGSLEREIAPYLRLKEKGYDISFVTYGNANDLHYQKYLSGIEISYNRWNFPTQTYARLIPLLHAGILSHADLIKTNQTNGAEVALWAAKFWRKPLIARCGYLWSDLSRSSGKQVDAQRASAIERKVFTQASFVVVTTPTMRDYVAKHYGVANARIRVIPNFVLTDVFSPSKKKPDPKRICFVGRLNEDKNLFSLIQACAGLDVELHFAGDGYLRVKLEEKAKELNVKLILHGNVPHIHLPDLIRQSALFALVSPHEGHPKSLLEAMSCGIAVMGANSPGIREQIVHGETGWLVGTDPESIRLGICHLMENPALREKMGRNARRYVLESYSLDKIVEAEFALYQETLNL